jgi:branched-chain amino acid transport system ATP-binding protein
MTAVLLEVRNLCVDYGRLSAVRNLNFSVNEGEIVCVVGPNGAGKSTTLLTIAGALDASRGIVRFAAETITGRPPEYVARKGISLVPEGRHIFSRLTVQENLLLGTFWRRDRSLVADDLENAFTIFPMLKQRLTSPAGRLSGGQQQQLAIARALMTRPRLILLDEPSLGLAPLVVESVYGVLRKLRESGVTLVIVEQNLKRALNLADRIHVIRQGSLQLTGTPTELRAHAGLEAAYFGYA